MFIEGRGYELYSEELKELIDKSELLAVKTQVKEVEPIHLFYCLISNDTAARNILIYMGINQKKLMETTKKGVLALQSDSPLKKNRGESAEPSRAYLDMLQRAYEEYANNDGRRDKLDSEYVLKAIARVPDKTMEFICEVFNINLARIINAIPTMNQSGYERGDGVAITEEDAKNNATIKRPPRKVNKYCIDLVEEARNKQKDPVIGRDNEVREAIEILSRKSKNNPILIGEAGVGKTAIVEGLAQRIARGDVPDSLKDKQVWSVDMTAMKAGTVLVGMFDERMNSLIKEVVDSDGQVILFIDEIHTIMGAGKYMGNDSGAADMLKPALARGQLHCIGATTLDEYRKFIEQDPALTRRFQKIHVDEPTKEDAVSILRGLKEKFEVFHGVKIMDSALTSAVSLSSRYITDRRLPDKAIDLIDTACAMIKTELGSMPSELDELSRRIMQLNMEVTALKKEKDRRSEERIREVEKDIATLRQKYEEGKKRWEDEKTSVDEVSKLKAQIEYYNSHLTSAFERQDVDEASRIKYEVLPRLEEKLNDLEETTRKNSILHEKVTDTEVAIVISRQTGIPLNKITQTEREKTLHLGDILHKRVIGQDEAVEKVSKAIIRSRAGIKDPKRPIGSFLFLGPTGVGKTELSKALAECMFDNEDNIVRLDMSEFMNKESINNLIGSPKGYADSEDGGRLTEPVRRKPYSVVLFDEVEKAHPDVFNLLLQIFDDGRLTDSKGHVVDFKNTILIMTSNLGSECILDGVGEDGILSEEAKAGVNEKLRGFFRPEFLNRIDETIMFKPLTKNDIGRIAGLMVKGISKRLEEQGITLTFTQPALEEVVEKGYEPAYGARPLRRFIQDNAETAAAMLLLENEEGGVKNIVIDLENGKFVARKGA